MTVIGSRVLLRGPVTSSGGLFRGDSSYDVTASGVVVDVFNDSVRVTIAPEDVSGVPRAMRRMVAELMEGWHSLADLGITPRVSALSADRATESESV